MVRGSSDSTASLRMCSRCKRRLGTQPVPSVAFRGKIMLAL
jgi:hypothetical protein